MFHLHRWTKWTEPRQVHNMFKQGDVEYKTIEHRQRRTCTKCGAIRERTL